MKKIPETLRARNLVIGNITLDFDSFNPYLQYKLEGIEMFYVGPFNITATH